MKKIFLSFLLCSHLFFFSTVFATIPKVSYENGFNTHPSEKKVVQDNIYHVCKAHYEDFMKYSSVSSEDQIPKILHFIWLGSPLPKRCQDCILTWKELHQDWTINIWTDQDVENFPMVNAEAYEAATNFGQKSDILRYEILYKYGGLYLDTDFECTKSFDEIHRSCSFYSGVGRCGKVVYNGLIGSSPGHPIIKACIDELQTTPGQTNSTKIMEETGPFYFGKIVCKIAPTSPRGSIAIFPPTFFYPYPGVLRRTMDKEAKETFSHPETMAIHYWATSWTKK